MADDQVQACEDEQPFLDPNMYAEELKTSYSDKFNSGSGPCQPKWKLGIVITVAAFLLSAILIGIGLLIGHFAIPNSGGTATGGSTSHRDEICANPPLVLISLDGFRAGYFELFPQNTSYFRMLGGVQAQYMKSVYPTKTFPNHFTIVTGLYPESHGIVDNHFYDRDLHEKFSIGSKNQNDPKWWLGEPVWVTAAKNGLQTGIYFWPGSEAPIQGILPNYYFPYDFRVTFEQRVKTALNWIDLPNESRPQFIALYFNQPDHAGHTAGPNSTDVDEALAMVSATIESFFTGLEDRDILDCVNVMIVSDHGMAMYNSSELVYLDDLIPDNYTELADITSTGVNAEIIVNGGDNTLEDIYNGIVQNADARGEPIRTFLLEDIPLRLHAGHFNQQRYGDIYLIGDVGSFITTRSVSYSPTLGLHGYDNDAVEMEAIFLAHGPAFKTGYTSEPFDNIQLYNLMCALLDIPPAANNGTVGSLNNLLKPDVAAAL